MIHYFIGDLGHFFVICSFVTAMVAAFSYFKATATGDLNGQKLWKANGMTAFYVHVFSVLGICVSLFIIIANHYFEYHYAYSYSDKKLPAYYLVSTFWNGQEGSFLLWMFWHAVLGLILIHTNRFWAAPVMTVFSLVQAFLASMILGVVLPLAEFRIGSSPFILLRDVMQDAPVFKMDPEFVPADGNGLNPLLQNYWMVIHPPTLFLGFASTLVPFSFCLAGLWLRKYRDWIRPALPWALFGGAVLGLGILMGGYWAYETLNFGGYWNWDPVENAVYVPWLVLIGAIHTMIIYRNSETALKVSIILVIAVFVLILYSTFLTRSGILGDSSVHSFTDLGLSGQLLIYLAFFLIMAIVLCVVRWKEIPSSDQEVSGYSREFWVFIGVLVLCLMGFQVLMPTSIPVWNKIVSLFGASSNMAPPPDQVGYYTKFQLWFAVAVALLSGIGQYFWWKKIDRKQLWKEIQFPLIISVLLFLITAQFIFAQYGNEIFTNPRFLVILFSGIVTVCLNAKILISLLKSSPGLSGGSVAHIGIGLMLLGILFSSGFSRVVSLNNTGLIYSREASEEFNRDNLLLFINEPRSMAGYKIEYKGVRLEPRKAGGYVNPNDVEFTNDDPALVVAKKNIGWKGDTIYHRGDTFEIMAENRYYEVQLTSSSGRVHTLYPRIQDNPNMGMAASPDIKRDLGRDLYAHVVLRSEPEDAEWSKMEEVRVKANQEFFANDYVCTLEGIERIFSIGNTPLDSPTIAIKASIRLKGEYQDYIAEPVFMIHNMQPYVIPEEVSDLGVQLKLNNVHPETNEFTIGIMTRQKDYIVLKALDKPLINVLWIGTILLMTGLTIAIVRRYKEFTKMKVKGLE